MLPPLVGCRLPAVTVTFLSIRFPLVLVDILPFFRGFSQSLQALPPFRRMLPVSMATYGRLIPLEENGTGALVPPVVLSIGTAENIMEKKKNKRPHLQRKGAPPHLSVGILSLRSPVSIVASHGGWLSVGSSRTGVAGSSSTAAVPPIRQGAL